MTNWSSEVPIFEEGGFIEDAQKKGLIKIENDMVMIGETIRKILNELKKPRSMTGKAMLKKTLHALVLPVAKIPMLGDKNGYTETEWKTVWAGSNLIVVTMNERYSVLIDISDKMRQRSDGYFATREYMEGEIVIENGEVKRVEK